VGEKKGRRKRGKRGKLMKESR